MRVVNDYTLVNVRVNKLAFKYIVENAFFIDDKSILKGNVAICFDFHIEHMIKKLDEKIDSTHSVIGNKEKLALKLELSELWVMMRKNGFTFTHVMAE